jgi:hypothetical protein
MHIGKKNQGYALCSFCSDVSLLSFVLSFSFTLFVPKEQYFSSGNYRFACLP